MFHFPQVSFSLLIFSYAASTYIATYNSAIVNPAIIAIIIPISNPIAVVLITDLYNYYNIKVCTYSYYLWYWPT